MADDVATLNMAGPDRGPQIPRRSARLAGPWAPLGHGTI